MKTWHEKVEDLFSKNINDTYTLNLAVSILEDRKELLETNLKHQEEIDRLNNIINELEKTLISDNEQVKTYNVEHPEARGQIFNFPSVYLFKLKELKEGNNGSI